MKGKINLLLLLTITLCSISAIAQSLVEGIVLDNGMPLPGASIVEKGTSNGTTTDFDGNFQLKTIATSGIIQISYVGYMSKSIAFNGDVNLGEITLQASENALEEVVIVGVVDIAKERETPVAVSTIKTAEIVERLGNQELPELLNATPSVYATKSGGGFGDSRINIRGFDQKNTAVLINGVPINDMENGSVYWSNWTGLADIASAMQVQRGLGSSKLAISSVGGTLNIVTKTTDRDEGGFVGATAGNNNYLKTIVSYSTGRLKNGLALTTLYSRTAGDGYISGTAFEGYNYFLGVGWTDNATKHNVQFTVTGAPQTHGQRTTSFFNMATLDDYLNYGEKYNYNHGYVYTLRGDDYIETKDFNWRKNFYHKPITSLNWDYTISETSKLSSVLYASFGRGGGTGDIGRINGNYASDKSLRNPETGLVEWDKIHNSNVGVFTLFGEDIYANKLDPYTNSYVVNNANLQSSDPTKPNYLEGIYERNGVVRRASMNSHNWFGALINFNTKLTEVLTLDIGTDLRTYKGFHYRRLNNLLGASGYRDNQNVNNPNHVVSEVYKSNLSSILNVFRAIDDEEKIDYYNIGYVRWAGIFGQLEYKKEALSAFVQFGGSQQGFKREDFFNYNANDPNRITDWEAILGGNIKAGLNYNINSNNNVFANAGYYSKQPFFDAVYVNYKNELNKDYRNEKVLGTELGYGLKINNTAHVKLNLYRTTWEDRFIVVDAVFDTQGDGIKGNNTDSDDSDDLNGTANISGVKQVHMGVELEAIITPIEKLDINFMASYGDWHYKGNPSGTVFDDSQNKLGTTQLVLNDVKVGNAAQFTTRLGIEVKPIERLKCDASILYADNLYADFNADEFSDTKLDGKTEADNGGEQLQLPGYMVTDAGVSYKIMVGSKKTNAVQLRLNVNNVCDEKYIAESTTNIKKDTDAANNYNGINKRNKVFFGFGRTWNFGVRFSF